MYGINISETGDQFIVPTTATHAKQYRWQQQHRHAESLNRDTRGYLVVRNLGRIASQRPRERRRIQHHHLAAKLAFRDDVFGECVVVLLGEDASFNTKNT